MIRRSFLLSGVACLLALPLAPAPVQAQDREEARILYARQVLEELRRSPDQQIPDRLLERAYGLVVVPDVLKGAFVFGVAGVGVMFVLNLAVSFLLALVTAMRAYALPARETAALRRALVHHVRTAPLDFLVPPRDARQAS